MTCVEFVDGSIGMTIPKQFIPAIEKGFMEVCGKGKGRTCRHIFIYSCICTVCG